MNDFFEENVFRAQNNNFFCFCRIQTLKSVTSSYELPHIASYTFDCFFRIVSSMKMKLSDISVAYDKHF